MRRLRGSKGAWLKDDEAKVAGLVRYMFGLRDRDLVPWVVGGLEVVFPYSREVVWGWVLYALARIPNGSAPGMEGIGNRLIQLVQDTRLGQELVDEVVDNLVHGVILPAWREMRVVFIPKPSLDLALTKS